MDERLKYLDWADHLGAILNDYKEGFGDEPLDGDGVDELTEIIRARLNLIEGNMTWDEYCEWEQRNVAMKPEK